MYVYTFACVFKVDLRFEWVKGCVCVCYLFVRWKLVDCVCWEGRQFEPKQGGASACK